MRQNRLIMSIVQDQTLGDVQSREIVALSFWIETKNKNKILGETPAHS